MSPTNLPGGPVSAAVRMRLSPAPALCNYQLCLTTWSPSCCCHHPCAPRLCHRMWPMGPNLWGSSQASLHAKTHLTDDVSSIICTILPKLGTKREPDKTDAHEALRKKIPSMFKCGFCRSAMKPLCCISPAALLPLWSAGSWEGAVSYKELRQTSARGEKITHTLETMEPH